MCAICRIWVIKSNNNSYVYYTKIGLQLGPGFSNATKVRARAGLKLDQTGFWSVRAWIFGLDTSSSLLHLDNSDSVR